MNIAHQIVQLNRFNHSESWKNWLIRIGYIFLQQTDLILTIYGISRGFTEMNPFINQLLGSPLQLIVVKVLIPLVLAMTLPAKLLLPAGGLLLFINIWDIIHLIV